MYSLLLAIIYLAFISLGLPDSLLGSAWPTIVRELDVPLSYAGIISMIISIGTIVSSLLSDKLTHKLGAGAVTAASVLMTALALLGFSLSRSFLLLCLLAIPYGLGAGAVDAALNNYVALHYKSRHMSWLHCFWGVGASAGPYIMGYAISNMNGWRDGYGTIAIIQLILTLGLFISLPLWRINRSGYIGQEEYEASISMKEAISIPGVKSVLFAFLAYCAFETTCGLWASTYFVESKSIDTVTAASYASLFYIGITVGRFASGFIADAMSDKNMIRLGSSVLTLGILLLALPVSSSALAIAGLVLAGVGAAPIYPSVIHSTPINFGKENSHAIVGIQMAFAYTGSTLMPPLMGVLAEHIGIRLYPFFLLIFALLMLGLTEHVNTVAQKKRINSIR
ncbi:MAG: MFS transporter [Ruminococcaceae bacterium]|nr:MFS transporter [Oscillospiraceae bacterium]